MRRAVAVVAIASLASATLTASAQDGRTPSAQVLLRGAGATFPAPLYERWIQAYRERSPNVRITYDAVGSGEGQRRFLADAVDFGASDAALSDEQIGRARSGARLVPVTGGIVVLAYNLPGLGGPLRLARDVYVDIFAGRIRSWNDPRIRATNPGLDLPHRSIAIVARQDSSGTTFAFTNHLAATSESWRDRGPGAGNLVDWRGAMTARGNEGVAGRIKVSADSIGYVEYHFAKRLGLAMAQLQNKAGRFVAPSDQSGQAALASVKQMPDNLRLFVPDPDGPESYPIVTYSWLLLHARYARPRQGVGAEAVRQLGPHRGAVLQPRSRIHPPASGDRVARAGLGRSHRVIRDVGPRDSALDHPTLRRINLSAVEASLWTLQREFAGDLGRVSAARDPFDDRVVQNMVAGYAFVDALAAERIDVLVPGNLKHLLEMNSLVLCGTSPARRESYRRHLEATEQRFYETHEGGIRDLVEWCASHKDDAVWERAAGAYVRMLSRPQLFIEGNHRTGALLMSLILVQGGQPPFVLSADTAIDYFGPSTAIRDVDKSSAATYFQLAPRQGPHRVATRRVLRSPPPPALTGRPRSTRFPDLPAASAAPREPLGVTATRSGWSRHANCPGGDGGSDPSLKHDHGWSIVTSFDRRRDGVSTHFSKER